VELCELPCLPDWLQTEVQNAEITGKELHVDVLQYSEPPEVNATSHWQTHCFGMHFRVRSAKASLVT